MIYFRYKQIYKYNSVIYLHVQRDIDDNSITINDTSLLKPWQAGDNS